MQTHCCKKYLYPTIPTLYPGKKYMLIWEVHVTSNITQPQYWEKGPWKKYTLYPSSTRQQIGHNTSPSTIKPVTTLLYSLIVSGCVVNQDQLG
jgi:hypothetical protein